MAFCFTHYQKVHPNVKLSLEGKKEASLALHSSQKIKKSGCCYNNAIAVIMGALLTAYAVRFL